jgi:hydroxymethylpyrimidine pyrophosphatase-like HAD family hydrolase
MLPWNAKLKLIVSDVDDTIAGVFKDASLEMIQELEKLLYEGLFIYLISGQSVKNIYNRVVKLIRKELCQKIIISHCNGAEVFYFNNQGELISEPVFSIVNIHKEKIDHHVFREITGKLLMEFHLEKFPVMDIETFKQLTAGNVYCVMVDDRGIQISFDFINGLRMFDYYNIADYLAGNQIDDIRIPIIKRAKELFYQAKLPMEPILAGLFAIDFTVAGVTKGLPIKNLITYGQKFQVNLPENIILTSYEDIEVWGDNFYVTKDGADLNISKALPPETRSISFRPIGEDEIPLNYNIVSWDGKYQLQEGLLEYLKSR